MQAVSKSVPESCFLKKSLTLSMFMLKTRKKLVSGDKKDIGRYLHFLENVIFA